MDKVIVITGASSGIGEATAKLLASTGNKIVLGARREERLKQIVSDIEKTNGESVYQVTDVTSVDSVKMLAKKAIEAYGRIDVWLNNAGVMPHSALIKGRVSDWDEMIDVNIKGVLYGINATLATMRQQKYGHIINIASVAGHHVGTDTAVYSATKHAVLAISDGLRQEEATAKSGVRVTVISPGAIETELIDHITDVDSKNRIDGFYHQFQISPSRIANAIKYAIDVPADTGINEIIIRPSDQVV
ncbi:SDR family oxidoreductase [Leuconostoc gasicomitatum]|uniref:SDR family oxidoreductase n=1 Tax=Leuconostoc gasicomitatum TaxID=115778 RepID=A0A9Q3SYF4_9LACO|nr:SDR family oxidoreductase [Leuconostoc gasicomitatum]MBZ5962902.1 SDR family oxidoreductase [Leuconostoc gasicomitatum]